jgi:hypothetical protein
MVTRRSTGRPWIQEGDQQVDQGHKKTNRKTVDTCVTKGKIVYQPDCGHKCKPTGAVDRNVAKFDKTRSNSEKRRNDMFLVWYLCRQRILKILLEETSDPSGPSVATRIILNFQ